MATSAVTQPILTAEQLLTFEDDGYRYDLIRGELHRMSPTGFEHGQVAAAIGAILRAFVHGRGLGVVVGAETGFVLARDPDVVLAPDAAYVRADRLPPKDQRHGYLTLAPDLVVEVVSPSDRQSYVTDKVMEYLDAGSPMVWVVDPRRRVVIQYQGDRTGRIIREPEPLDGGAVLPGFRVSLNEVFE